MAENKFLKKVSLCKFVHSLRTEAEGKTAREVGEGRTERGKGCLRGASLTGSSNVKSSRTAVVVSPGKRRQRAIESRGE